MHSDKEDVDQFDEDRSRTLEYEIAAQDIVGGEENVDDDEDDVESKYAASDELESCSSTDDDELDLVKPKYVEFNEQIDMSDSQFQIGMKFKSFKQFKEAVRNYGIKNRCVINFKPNNKKRCKAFCKKGCPFYLWDSLMIKDKSKVIRPGPDIDPAKPRG